MIFGAPSSGGTVPASYLPTLWRTIGPYLPAGAGTTAVRNTIYFDGNRIAPSLIILAAYLVIGALAVFLLIGGARQPAQTPRRRRPSRRPSSRSGAQAHPVGRASSAGRA